MPPTRPDDPDQIRAAVAARYAGLARAARAGQPVADCDPDEFAAGGFGSAGKVYGLDMTEEMLDLARAHARQAGAGNAEFLRGHIEAIPLPDGSVDVVISNCVICLSADRPAVFAESFRVLRPGGRLGVTDLLAEDRLTPAQRIERGGQAGCAGVSSFAEYRAGLATAGFTGIAIASTHQVADGVHSAIIRAARP